MTMQKHMRLVIVCLTVVLTGTAGVVQARSLPDFTDLVEQSVKPW